MLLPLAKNDYDWNPERSTSGPITMVMSAADKAIYVYRNGNPIGRARVEIGGRGALGNHVFSLLEGTTGRGSFLVPGRQARRWMCVTSRGGRADAEKITSRLRMNPEFAGKVYDMIAPGMTVIITRSAGRAQPQRAHPRKLKPASPGAAVEMIAATTPANCNFTELQRRPIERARASKGRQLKYQKNLL